MASSLGACGTGSGTSGENADVSVVPLYAQDERVIGVDYEGLDFEGLESANQHYGSEKYGDAEVGGGCSITFANYIDGTTGAVRNMDLQRSDYCSYQLMIRPGDNVKHPVWALSYTGVDDKSYGELLETGMNGEHYKMLPFQTTDAMSFGLNEDGEEGSLYCAILMRSDQEDEDGNYIWTCSGTNPGIRILFIDKMEINGKLS